MRASGSGRHRWHGDLVEGLGRPGAICRRPLWLGAGVAVAVVALLLAFDSGHEDGSPGGVLYSKHCASCHGANLEGQPDWKRRLPDGRLPAPPHDATGHTWHHADAYLFDVTKRGGQATAPAGFVSGMPAFEAALSDDEIWSILEFIKSRWPAEIRKRQPR